ncbi:MAG TPA: hypothetical protein PKE47_13410 [Verrucomicrobiota bacterium]|nr:hypothetical protein [Verrucomicrobiota bacterium]
MNLPEDELLRTLEALEAAVAGLRGPGPKPDVAAHLRRVDELAAALPPDADPELRHFLVRKSYQKARLHLAGRAAERGACGRG